MGCWECKVIKKVPYVSSIGLNLCPQTKALIWPYGPRLQELGHSKTNHLSKTNPLDVALLPVTPPAVTLGPWRFKKTKKNQT